MGRPDGQLCDQNYEIFAKNLSCLRATSGRVRHCHPDGRTSTASNFLTKASRVRTRGMAVRTVDLLHAISISVERASGRLNLNCDSCLMLQQSSLI
jgi:hypothetical protein